MQVKNEAQSPLALYVVHHADVGLNVKHVRVVATLILMPGETCTQDEFCAYLNTAGCAFKAALVAKNGALVLNDPRQFGEDPTLPYG